MTNKAMEPVNYSNLLDRIGRILVEAGAKVVREINKAQVIAYWEIAREIVEFEQKGKARGEYGEHLIEKLSKDMAPKFGKGVSPTNLKMMRLFYQRHCLGNPKKCPLNLQFNRQCLVNFK